jgi:hypothetical protein
MFVEADEVLLVGRDNGVPGRRDFRGLAGNGAKTAGESDGEAGQATGQGDDSRTGDDGTGLAMPAGTTWGSSVPTDCQRGFCPVRVVAVQSPGSAGEGRHPLTGPSAS